MDEDLWLDDGLEELFLGVPGDFGASSEIVGGTYPFVRRKKKVPTDFPSSGMHVAMRSLALGREAQKIESHRQTQIAAVRDVNLQKAQAVQAANRKRQEEIAKTRMKNLKKAWKTRQ